MERKSKVFYCYSPALKCELLNTGEKYIAKGIHPTSNRYYWIFLRTDELNTYLDQRPKFVK